MSHSVCWRLTRRFFQGLSDASPLRTMTAEKQAGRREASLPHKGILELTEKNSFRWTSPATGTVGSGEWRGQFDVHTIRACDNLLREWGVSAEEEQM
ncbi:hypothetical protein HPB50_016657 [Hyalomma asiaticum]|uniref:Uncharacterized protein n=1 Tax=Hyalomma asiaticum TaxID=266040 RepID=A0ACB7TIL1_HYAAI|nr:hypothetical protein HPB50_016657 [Hyalomma asiaticum]